MSESQEIMRKETAPAAAEQTKNSAVFSPAVDIYQTEGGLVLMADLPGVAQEDLHVRLEDELLTIEGDVKAGALPGSPLLQEYQVGSYYRQFSISERIDRNRIEATLKNGELKLVLPKAESAKPHKISVQSD